MLLKHIIIIIIIRNNTVVFLRTNGTLINYLDAIIRKLSRCSHRSNFTGIRQTKSNNENHTG